MASRAPSPSSARVWLAALLAAAALTGCRTTPRAAAPAPRPSPSSIAYTDPVRDAIPWTTSVNPKAATLRRRADGTLTAAALGTGGGRGPGTALERRFRGRGDPGPWELLTTLHSTWVAGGAFEAGGDAPDLWINRFRVSLEKSTGNYGRFGAFGTYVNRRYSWSGSNPLVPTSSEPFESVHTFRAGVNHFQPLNEKWAVFLMVTGSWSAADTADLSDSFSWAVTGFVGRRITPKFDLGVGLIVGKLFEDELYVFGGPQFGWRPNERFSIVLEGTQLDFNYTPPGKWEFGVSGAFLISRFRLSEAAPQSSQIVQDWRLPMWARARYRCLRNLDLEFRAGFDARRTWSIEDAQGENSRSYASDPAPLLGLRAIWQL